MSKIKIRGRNLFLILVIFQLLVTITIASAKTVGTENSISKNDQPSNDNDFLQPTAELYNATLNWVKTEISLDKKGLGEVTIILNCTPTSEHFGTFIKQMSEENKEIVAEKTYAMVGEEKLALTVTVLKQSNNYAFLVYLVNTSAFTPGIPLIYYITYTANFYTSGQITHYAVDTDLVSINLLRPTWSASLDYRELKVILPVEVPDGIITSEFLTSIQIQMFSDTETYYNLNYTAEIGSEGKYWFVLTASKPTIDYPVISANATFEVTFYLSLDYFSLPWMINWLVITLVVVFVLVAFSFFLVIIGLKKRTKTEIEEFKVDLHKVLKQQEE
ncbi:MAG: hypothetical protein ACTSO7_11960 [Candidatus Heimdallarchaeota archaeon]